MSQLADFTYGKAEEKAADLRSTLWNRQKLFQRLISLQSVLDRSSGFALGGLLIFLAVWFLAASRAKLLWFDELLGLAIANMRSFGEMISALRAQIDYGAPLYHFVDHFVLRGMGYSATSARLPAFLGICTLLVTLYVFVSRRLPPIFGLLAAMLIVCTPARTYMWEGRPYGMVLGLAGIALLMYQRITDRTTDRGSRTFALIIYSLCCGALVATHYFAILVIGAFLTGELVRYIESGKIDWPVVAGSLIPPSAVLLSLSGVIRSQMEHRVTPGLLEFMPGYDRFRFDTWALCIAVGLVALGIWLQGDNAEEHALPVAEGFRSHELAVAGTLLLLPIIGAVFGHYLTHAYIARYFLSEVIGLCILICYGLATASKRCPAIAVMMVLACVVLLLEQGGYVILFHQPGKASGAEWQSRSDQILFESPGDFLQAYEYYPERRGQFWFAAEPETAMKFGKFDLDDRNLVSLRDIEPMHVVTLQSMVQANPEFVLFPSTDANVGWAANCLLNSGADLKIAKIMGGPSYLFKVTVPSDSVAAVGVCPVKRQGSLSASSN